ncbi:hypothetical protein JTB14_030923 [Gonioctena quinquepunctata]|nr:hypothetical protein JTB14_030923 [Gonioctena quinquepunctata]
MEIFHETEFASSLTTDMVHVDAETGSLEKNAEVLDPDEITNACSPQDGTSADEQQIPQNHILSSKTILSQDKQRTPQNNILDEQPCSSKTITSYSPTIRTLAISPRVIRPLPKKRFTQPNKRKCGTTAILTSSPYKNEREKYKIKLNPQ